MLGALFEQQNSPHLNCWLARLRLHKNSKNLSSLTRKVIELAAINNFIHSFILIMRDFPSCFSESGVQIADSTSSSSTSSTSSKASQNLVTCVYQSQFQSNSCLITITWSKNLMGQGVNIGIQSSTNPSLCRVDIKPWLFTRRKGFRSIEVDSIVIDIYWDFSSAKFGSGPEPLEGFYLAVAFNQELILLLGDMQKEVYKKIDPPSPVASGAVFVAKKEHIFGKKLYSAKAQFCDKGQIHDIVIECHTGGINDPSESLIISIDSRTVMQVKRLRWKFRGNQTILVDGLHVEVYWDVHSWFFGNVMGNAAVFLFRTSVSAEKLRNSHSTITNPSVFSWSGSQKLANSQSQQGQSFSLILYAWRIE
ncbi:hypothetical protein ACH5RR_010653 [Cinchona calisaya]|uniref:DUF868 domain-containing protein n=1 Tax=Cinchona calisaya TaxID=153742 RepID=A0ABD3AJI0_9GENT